MGDPRLLRVAEPVKEFGTPELEALIADMFDTMHAANGAGLAAPQIGVNLRLVIYGFKQNTRYPDAPPVPETVPSIPSCVHCLQRWWMAGKVACRCRVCVAWCHVQRLAL